jgi:hypothetical protein
VSSHHDFCQALLAASRASLVALVGQDGLELARAGHVEGVDATAVAESVMLAADGEYARRFPEGGERMNLCGVLAAPGLVLIVLFDEQSSLGLVRLRARQAIKNLRRSEQGGGGSSEGGAPAAVTYVDETPARRD